MPYIKTSAEVMFSVSILWNLPKAVLTRKAFKVKIWTLKQAFVCGERYMWRSQAWAYVLIYPTPKQTFHSVVETKVDETSGMAYKRSPSLEHH